MNKSFFLLVPAAFGSLMMTACSDESSSSGTNSNQSSACTLNPSETGLEITCNNESYGFLKTSSGGVYGSCGAEALRDDSGFKLVCGGDSVGVVYNGKAGRNGVNGDNGLNGQNGENGTSCEAKKVESGFELFCGEKKVGLIPNGHSCTVSKTDGASVISCEDGTEATVLNGINGKNGTNGINGTSCTTSSLKSIDIDGGVYSTITCGTTTVKIYDGAKGEQGEQGEPGENCTVSKNTTTGVTTITCGDDVAKVYDGENGAAGKNGDNCSIEDNGDGTATITCGTGAGASTYIVKDGAAGANGDNCSIEDNGDGTATITCGTGASASTYIVKDGAAGAKGDAGYGCSAMSYTGYAVISCQSGVDDEEEPVYKKDTILAAGYVKCGTAVYEASKGVCEEGSWTAYTCGSAMLGADQFCENGVAYTKADYWTEATTYPKATYGRCDVKNPDDTTDVTIGEYYLLASQYCIDAVAKDKYQECGGVLFNATTHFCYASTVYALCGDEPYNPETHFCVSMTPYNLETYGPCGETYYNKSTQTCENGVPTPIAP